MADNDERDVVGQAVSGGSGLVVIRERDTDGLGMGDLVACDHDGRTTILGVCDLEMGSQLAERVKELMSGTMMGDGPGNMKWYEPGMPNYMLATAKQLVTITNGRPGEPKKMVPSFTDVRRITPDDLSFMDGPGPGRLYMGKVRTGSGTVVGDGLWMNASEIVTHHTLIVAATGRGKSNLVKCILWELLGTGGVGMLVLDAHGEYSELSSHTNARERLVYYTSSKNPRPGDISLNINTRSVRPVDLRGVVELSDAQDQVMEIMHNKHRGLWIEHLEEAVRQDEADEDGKKKGSETRRALLRKVRYALGLMRKNSAFSMESGIGANTVKDIVGKLDAGQIVVVDTSEIGVNEEQTIGNMLSNAILSGRRDAKSNRRLAGLPPVGIVVEEAPRLLENAVATNAYSAIAREGRKFKVGLIAITQLASVIPDSVLANLTTKIVFGNHMLKERKAIMESAAQDLSDDSRNIALLEPGEAIVTSVFVPFAIPIMVPLFDDLMKAGSRPPQKVRVVG